MTARLLLGVDDTIRETCPEPIQVGGDGNIVTCETCGGSRSVFVSHLIVDAKQIQVPNEGLARQFNEAHQRLAPNFRHTTREVSAVPWKEMSADNKALMVAIATEVGGVVSPKAGWTGEVELAQRRPEWEDENVRSAFQLLSVLADVVVVERSRVRASATFPDHHHAPFFREGELFVDHAAFDALPDADLLALVTNLRETT